MPYAPIQMPINITSPYGPREIDYGSGNFHHGLDMVTEGLNQEVYAVTDGFVVESGPAEGYGQWIVVEHVGADGQTFYTTYGDLQERYVFVGDSVRAGDALAGYGVCEGQTGTGDHIHFQVSVGDYNGWDGIDPVLWKTYAPWLIGDFSRTMGAGSGGGGSVQQAPFFSIESFIDFTGKIQEIIDIFAEGAVKGIKLITSIVYYIIGILMTIDFSLTFILDSFDLEKTRSESYSIFKLLILKALLYCFFFFLIINWGSVLGESSKSLFVTTAAMAGGADTQTAEQVVSSPMFIITKGMRIISPLFAALGSVGNNVSLLHPLESMGEILGNGLLMFFFIIVLILCFILFTYQICLAYLEFFFVMLFSLSNFMWAGIKQTRRYAANGVGSIFCVSAKLFFYTFLALMMQNVLQDIIVDDLMQPVQSPTKNVTDKLDGRFGSVEEIAHAIAIVESNGRYDLYKSGGAGTYGAYQFKQGDWDKLCREYEAKNPLDKLCLRNDGDSPQNAPSTNYGWCKDNQDKVALTLMRNYYAQTNGDYHELCELWRKNGPALEDADNYWRKVSGANGATLPMAKHKTIGILACLKLTAFALLFVLLGDKIGTAITQTWSGSGLVFTE